MTSLYFWKSWNKPYKQLYFTLLFLFGFVIISLFFALWVGFESVAPWEVETEVEPVKVVVDQFSKSLFNFTTEADSYYALDTFVTTEIRTSLWHSYTYLAVLVIAVIMLLTIFSYLELYWFMGSALLVLFFFISLKFELIELFGRTDRIPTVIAFILFSGLGYYFNSFYKKASISIRLLSFIGLSLGLGLLIQFKSGVSTPFLYLTNFSVLFPVAVAMIFVFLVGHDIIKGFLYVVSSTKTIGSKNSIVNFVFASVLYLANILVLLLKKLSIFTYDIVFINPFLLLFSSAVLGIWMFKKRSEMFSKALPFIPAGAFLYLSLAVITFAGISYAFITGNSGLLDAYEQIIIYGHLFIGFIFFLYVMVNFGALFNEKISIYEIVYKPAKLTFLIVPTAALALSSFFFLYQRKYPYYLAISGYYTAAGDVMVHEAEFPMAFQYYREAIVYDHPSHRANYSIASLSSFLGDRYTAKGYFENALSRDPSVQAYVGLSNAYLQTGELFKGMYQLKEAIQKFPEEGRLLNNLAVVYHKLNLADSSIHYFLKAKSAIKSPEVPTSNVLYVLAKKNLFVDADSIIDIDDYPKMISFVNNKLAILNQLGKSSNTPFDESLLPDSLLNANTFAYLVNSNVNALKSNAPLLDSKLEDYLSVAGNQFYKERLELQRALKKYYQQNRLDAINDCRILEVNASSTNFDYASLLGKWYLEQACFSEAQDYFQKASKGGNLYDQLNFTIAAAHAGNKDEALFVLEQLVKSPNNEINKIASTLLQLLSIKSTADLAKLTDAAKVQYLYINASSILPAQRNYCLTSLSNDQARAYAYSFLCNESLKNSNDKNAVHYWNFLSSIQGLNEFALLEKNYTELLWSVNQSNKKFLDDNALTLGLPTDKEMTRYFFMAKSAELNQDSVKAIEWYKKSLLAAPFIETMVDEAVRYLSAHGEADTAYQILIEVLKGYSSPRLLITYVNLCMDIGYVSYAESTLEELKEQLPKADYQKLLVKFNEFQGKE